MTLWRAARLEWYDRLRNSKWPSRKQEAVGTAAANATETWLADTLATKGEVLQLAERNMSDKRRHWIDWSVALQRVHFPFEREPGLSAHRDLIAECLMNHLRPVIPAYVSVSHDLLNEWVTDQTDDTEIPSDFVLEPDEAIGRITNRSSRRIYRVAISICLPSVSPPDPVAMDGVLRRTVDALFEAGLPRTAASVIARYENDPDPLATYAQVATDLPTKTRAAEEKRLEMVKHRTADAVAAHAETDLAEKSHVDATVQPDHAEPSRPSIAAPGTHAAEQHRRDLIVDAVVQGDFGIAREQVEACLLDDKGDEHFPPLFPAHSYRQERLERERQTDGNPSWP